MKKSKKDFVIIIISIVVLFINNVAISKYDYSAAGKAQVGIAKAIIRLEKDEIIQKQIDQNSFPIEYNFTIHNFDKDKINEIDLSYVIQIDVSTEDFPVSYFLFDCENNTEMQLVEGKTNPINLKKLEQQSRHFKLYLQWREIDQPLAENIEIKLKLNAIQNKEEK